MIVAVIRWSLDNRLLVLLLSACLTVWGLWSVRHIPLDALPDLSDVQVIVRTSYPGQAPQIVEDQVTYPLATQMMAVPGARTVRGYSFFGDSFIYVLFDDDVDLYWARSRVLEYLSQAQARLPATARPALGPDATGLGWIYQYALVDRSGQHDISELTALQDWFLKYELQTLENVAEVATIGGMVQQFQVVLDPLAMANLGITHDQVRQAVQRANQESGGGVLTLAETEFMVRASGYLDSLDSFSEIPLAMRNGTPVRLADVAHIRRGPEMRRGVAELDGEGEVVGGVVILRAGADARDTLLAVRERLTALRASLPAGVEIVPTYDRSVLIDNAIATLSEKLLDEFIVVALVCLVFLWHMRSALVAVIALPLGVLTAFIVMYYQGINANIMSLGGIAIAIGAMVDAAIVMIENAHKKIEHWQQQHPDQELTGSSRWQVIGDAAVEVGPALFFSLLIITLSFIPIFSLQAQEGRLFGPLAYTKTWAMAAAAGLSVTLVPVLMGLWIRGRIPPETANPVSRWLIAGYRPLLDTVLAWPRLTALMAVLIAATSWWPLTQLGGEFLPPLDEGDLLYMPSALPGLSVQKAAELLQQSDRMIRAVPEVAQVFGKAGRAKTATDPAPISMFETTVRFKPKEQWRDGMTLDKLIDELDSKVQIPGLANVWIPPLRNRIDMLATGIRSPIGVRVAGDDLAVMTQVAEQIEEVAQQVAGVTSVLAERVSGGRYVDIDIDRAAAARHGLNIADIHSLISGLVGGETISESIDGRARFPINLRYGREWRDTPQRLRELPLLTSAGEQITLGAVASIGINDGPAMLKTENGRLIAWVFVDVRGRDLVAVVEDLRALIAREVSLPAAVSISFGGQFEFLERANQRLLLVVPATLMIIFLLLFLAFRRIDEALLILLTLPLALTGGLWLLYLLEHRLSVASVVGFIALAGVAAEFGVIMLLYLRQAWQQRQQAGNQSSQDLHDAICEGAVLRVRPKVMTVAVIVIGLLPVLLGAGTGSEIMSRIAAPMIGGMISAPLLSLLVLPVAWRWLRRHEVSVSS